MDLSMIMAWLAPALQGLIQAFFEAFFSGWFDTTVEEVVVALSRASPVIVETATGALALI